MGLVGTHDADALWCFQWHNPLPLVWEREPEWGDGGQWATDSALQARPGVWPMSWLPVHNCWHSLLPWLAGLLPIWGKKSQRVSLIGVTTRGSKTITARGLNKEVRMEWSTLGCPIGNTPTHHYSPGGGPADKLPPANPQHPVTYSPARLNQAAACCLWRRSSKLSMGKS